MHVPRGAAFIMNLRYLLLFFIFFLKDAYTAETNKILTCPPEVYEINGLIVSPDRQWIELPDGEDPNSSNIKKHIEKIKNYEVNPKTATPVSLFRADLSPTHTMCVLIGKINPRLYYLVSNKIYLPANPEKWSSWAGTTTCGNLIPENGKPLPIDYCIFKLKSLPTTP